MRQSLKIRLCQYGAACLLPLPLLVLADPKNSLDAMLDAPLASLTTSPTRLEAGLMLVEDPRNQPVATTILTSSDIIAFGYRSLADVFNALPGLYTANDQSYTYAGARGLIGTGNFNSRILVTIDGYRFNDNMYHQVGLVGPEFPIDIELIDRVEFVPGPGRAENGLNAFLGTVNLVTRSAANNHQGELSASASHHSRMHGRATVFTPLADGSLMLSVSKMNFDGEDKTHPTTGLAVSGLGYERNDKVFAKYERGPLQANVIFSDRIKQVPNQIEYTEPYNPNTWYRDTWQLADVRYRLLDTEQAEMSGRIHWGNYLFQGNYAYAGDVNYRGGAEGSWWGVDLQGALQVSSQHRLSGGLGYQNNYQQWLFTGEIGSTTPVIDETRATQSSFAWLEDHWQASHALQIFSGIRLDQDMQDKRLFSPRVGAIYQINEQHLLRFNWANAWITPSDYQLRYGSEDPTSGFQSPNLTLRPEQMVSYDLGFESQLAHVGRVVASIFYYQTQDLIELVTPANSTQEVHLNLNNIDATGLQLEWSPPLKSGWRFTSSATYQQVTEADSPSGAKTDTPQTLLKMNLRTPAILGVFPAFEAQHISERTTRTGSKTAEVQLLNMTFTKYFQRDLRLQVAIFNVLNTTYYAPISPDFPSPVAEQGGRFVRLKVEWQF